MASARSGRAPVSVRAFVSQRQRVLSYRSLQHRFRSEIYEFVGRPMLTVSLASY